MGTVANPLLMSTIPGATNPSGSPITQPIVGGSGAGSTGQNPYMPQVPSSGSGSATNNPLSPLPVPTSGPTKTATAPLPATGFPALNSPFGTSPGAPGTPGSSPIQSGLGGSLTPAQNTALARNLEKTYGQGIATLMMNFLNSGAGYNPQVLAALVAQLQPQFAGSQAALNQNFSAGGNRFGSGAQIGMADLLSQQNAQVGSMEAQLYEQSVQNFMTILMGASGPDASRIAKAPSTMDALTSGLNLAGTGAQGASGIISAISPSADTGVLDAIGALALA